MKNLEFMKELISRMDSQQLAHILTNAQCGNCWNMDCNLLGSHDIVTCRANVQRWLELPCKEENPNYEVYMPCHNGG